MYDCDYHPYPNSLIDVYTRNGTGEVTAPNTYEVTAVNPNDFGSTSHPRGYTGATGPTGRRGANPKIYRCNIPGDTGLETAITGNPIPAWQVMLP